MSKKYLNRCGHQFNHGRLGHYGGLNNQMNDRSKQIDEILIKALKDIDVKFEDAFRKAHNSDTSDVKSMGQRDLLELKHILRL